MDTTMGTQRSDPIPVHQWTYTGSKVLIVKCVDADGTSYGGFQWPLEVGAVVNCPDWDPSPSCGHGLHGWPWGIAWGDGKCPNYETTWIVFGADPADVVSLGGKCKAKRAVVRFVGDWQGALEYVRPGQIAWIHQAARGKRLTTGGHAARNAKGHRATSTIKGAGAASSAEGDRVSSTATGDHAASRAYGYHASSTATGDCAASSAGGYRSASIATGNYAISTTLGVQSVSATTGDNAASSATSDRAASIATGVYSSSSADGRACVAVVTGYEGRAKAGPHGCIALCWWNPISHDSEIRCREVGDGSDPTKLKPNTWYRLSKDGEFVEE